MSGVFQSQKFWGQAQFSLQEVKRLLSDSFGLGQFAFDYENVFEWFEAQGADGSHWNVSRKHDGDGQPSFDDYLIIAISPIPKNPRGVGQMISNALSCSVSFGEGATTKTILGNSWSGRNLYRGRRDHKLSSTNFRTGSDAINAVEQCSTASFQDLVSASVAAPVIRPAQQLRGAQLAQSGKARSKFIEMKVSSALPYSKGKAKRYGRRFGNCRSAGNVFFCGDCK